MQIVIVLHPACSSTDVELYGLREFLEGAAARFADQHASPLEIETLREMNAEGLAIGEDPTKQAVLNRRFHAAIG